MSVRKLVMLIFAMVSIQSLANAKTINTIANQTVVKNYTIATGDTLVMNGNLFIDSGAVLTIKPGAVVKGKGAQSAMVICRGSKIIAKGTVDTPIVFTAFNDNLGEKFSDSIKAYSMGLWGGLVIMGKARISAPGDTGVLAALRINDHRAVYGGTDDNDNSGILEYVSIRFAGSGTKGDDPDVTDSLDDQYDFAGLNLCGVGSGTVINNVETYNCQFDGIRLWGGAVNLKHFAALFSHDNCLDIEQGYHGKCQHFLLMYRESSDGVAYGPQYYESLDIVNHRNHPDSSLPLPVFSNFTIHGETKKENHIFRFESEAAGKYYNGVMLNVGPSGSVNCDTNLQNGSLLIANSTFFNNWNNASNNKWTDFASPLLLPSMLAKPSSSNSMVDPKLKNNIMYNYLGGRDMDTVKLYLWDFRPTDSIALKKLFRADSIVDTAFFDRVEYKGAFSPYASGKMWLRGWSALEHYRFLDTTNTLIFNDPPGPPLSTNDVNVALTSVKNGISIQRTGLKVILNLPNVILQENAVAIYRLNGTKVNANIIYDKQRVIVDLGSSHLSKGQYLCRVKTGKSVKSFLLPYYN